MGSPNDIIHLVNPRAITVFVVSVLVASETIAPAHEKHIQSDVPPIIAPTASPVGFGGARTALDEEAYSLMPWAPPQVRNSFLESSVGWDWQHRVLYEIGGLKPVA